MIGSRLCSVFAFGDEFPELLDDLPGAPRLIRGFLHQALGLFPVGLVRAVQQAAAGFEIVDDRRERLVQLVGEGGGHLAELGET